MVSPPPPAGDSGVQKLGGRIRPRGFFENAKKGKHSFIQFFAMTGILLLSARSLTQKYRIHELTEDIASLEEEQKGLISRMNHIKQSLLSEAALEPTGAFATRLRLLFGDEIGINQPSILATGFSHLILVYSSFAPAG